MAPEATAAEAGGPSPGDDRTAQRGLLNELPQQLGPQLSAGVPFLKQSTKTASP